MNGQESDPLMSSFRKSLNDDKTSCVIQRTGLGPLDPEWEADRLELSGTIYVARSLSTVPEIAENRLILHKIGVTSQQISRRIADARNDATFLMAPVEIVATYKLRNMSRSKVESLLHRFFEAARPAELSITDRMGKKIHPREWFYVLPEHVDRPRHFLGERPFRARTGHAALQQWLPQSRMLRNDAAGPLPPLERVPPLRRGVP